MPASCFPQNKMAAAWLVFKMIYHCFSLGYNSFIKYTSSIIQTEPLMGNFGFVCQAGPG